MTGSRRGRAGWVLLAALCAVAGPLRAPGAYAEDLAPHTQMDLFRNLLPTVVNITARGQMADQAAAMMAVSEAPPSGRIETVVGSGFVIDPSGIIVTNWHVVSDRQLDLPVDVIIPPRSTAAPSPDAGTAPTQRDWHVQLIRDKGRTAWQRATGYGRRSLGETAMSAPSHMWTAASSQGVMQCFDQIACVHMSGLSGRSHMNAGQDGFRDRGSKQHSGLSRGPLAQSECPASWID